MSRGYTLAYRLGVTPWERYPQAAAARLATLIDREEADHPQPTRRALDLGCGRGLYSELLAGRGWDVVGVDVVPQAVDQARRRSIPGARFEVGDVTTLEVATLGRFDLFLDIGCFQGLTPEQQRAEACTVEALANPGATLLLLAFGATPMARFVGGSSTADVQTAFAGWQTLAVEDADTKGLGWPLNKTGPQWHRLRRPAGG